MANNKKTAQKPRKIYDVYIMNSFSDTDFIEQSVVPRLESAKLKVFFEKRELLPGDKWEDKLTRALETSKNCLIVVSSEYSSHIKDERPDSYSWSKRELELALILAAKSELRVIPILIDYTDLPEKLRPFLSANLSDETTQEDEWKKLIDSLSSKRRIASKTPNQTVINIENMYGGLGTVGDASQPKENKKGTTLGDLDNKSLGEIDALNENVPEDIANLKDNDNNSKTPEIQSNVNVDGSALSDAYSKNDLLGYSDYVKAIANFIESPKTKKPITIGIDAVWGGGKTTLMRLLEERLNPPSEKMTINKKIIQLFSQKKEKSSIAERKQEHIYTVWFNAWQYDQQETLWAAFVLEILEQIRKQCNWITRTWLFFSINSRRFNWAAFFWDTLKSILAGAFIAAAGFGAYSLLASYLGKDWKDTFEWLKDFFKIQGAVALSALAYTILKDATGLFVSPFSLGISRYIKEPNYKNKVGFVSQFQEDFKWVINAITQRGKWPLVVFIDDLDRCSSPKAVEIIEAINLLLDSEHCVFIIGMDSMMLSRSIQAKYKDIQPFFENVDYPSNVGLGRHFLEKIIQIDFHIPQPDKPHIAKFIDSQLGRKQAQQNQPVVQQVAESLIQAEQRAGKAESEAKQAVQEAHPDLPPAVLEAAIESVQERSFEDLPEVVQIVNELAYYLNYNPRRIKRFINMYRLQSLIAYQRNILETVISLDTLACWLVISMRWPEFVSNAIKDTRIISEVRLDILQLEKAKDKTTEVDQIRKSKKYSPDILPLLTNPDFGELLNKIKGKAGDAENYFHLAQLSLTE